SLKLPKRQAGFLIPLAIFIVVVMGLLALALARTTTQTGLATAQELLSLQAFYAAESGAQHGLNWLFSPDVDPSSIGYRNGVDSRCEGYVENLNFAGVTGLASCSAAVTCECEDDCPPTAPTNFYTITSEGRCGSGAIS